jgi:uncharacterized membrane protein
VNDQGPNVADVRRALLARTVRRTSTAVVLALVVVGIAVFRASLPWTWVAAIVFFVAAALVCWWQVRRLGKRSGQLTPEYLSEHSHDRASPLEPVISLVSIWGVLAVVAWFVPVAGAVLAGGMGGSQLAMLLIGSGRVTVSEASVDALLMGYVAVLPASAWNSSAEDLT